MNGKEDDGAVSDSFCPRMLMASLADHADMVGRYPIAGYILKGELIRLFANGRVDRILIRRLHREDCLGQA